MIIVPGGGTFPAYKPKRHLDLFLASREAKIQNLRVLTDVVLSDHLPVVLEAIV